MKVGKLFLLLLITSLSVMPAFAGLATGEIISASSDCESVTLTYEIFSLGGDVTIEATGLATKDVPEVTGIATVTFPIPAQEPGTIIHLSLLVDGDGIDEVVFACTVEETAPIILGINDGRVEPFATDMVIYPLNDGIYIYSDTGEIVLFIPLATIDLLGIPEGEPRLLAESIDGYVQIFRMSDGRFQAVIGPDGEGKFHVATWDGLGFVSGVESNTFE